MINQDLMIYRKIMPYDIILENKINEWNAIWDEENNEVISSDRWSALKEFNKQGYRVLQFLLDKNDIYTEWVLVEKLQEGE